MNLKGMHVHIHFGKCGHTEQSQLLSPFVTPLIVLFSLFFLGQARCRRLRDRADGRHSHEANRLRQRVATLHPRVHFTRHIKGFLWLLHEGEGRTNREKIIPLFY